MEITRTLKYAATPIHEYSVHCDECGNHETLIDFSASNKIPVNIFEHYGWRTIKGKTLCPKCAKEVSNNA